MPELPGGVSAPMAELGLPPEALSLQGRFLDLCREVQVLDKRKQWVSLDRLWWEVEHRTHFAALTTEYLRLLLGSRPPETTVIVCPDTISSSFGVTPAVFIAAHALGCPVAVWQEVGDLAGHRPAMIGTSRRRLDCLVVQDVIRHGITILKMLNALAHREWSLVAYACFVLNTWDAKRLDGARAKYKALAGCELHIQYLATADALA